MAPLPDYDQLKSTISRHWDPGYPESAIGDKDVIELCTLEAEEQNISLEEFLLREATGAWVKWIDRVRNKEDSSTNLSSIISKIEKDFSDNEELKEEMINDAVEEKRIEGEDCKFLRDSGIIDLLDVQDLSSYQHLNEIAEKLGVKSWQLTEYIESLRDELRILPLHYEKNRQINENQQAAASPARPVNDVNITSSNNTTFNPSQNPQLQAQPSEKSNLIPGLLSGIGLLLIILIAVVFGQNNNTANMDSQNPGKSRQYSQKQTNNSSSAPPEKSIYFSGINLPVTNKLCNQKKHFASTILLRWLTPKEAQLIIDLAKRTKGSSYESMETSPYLRSKTITDHGFSHSAGKTTDKKPQTVLQQLDISGLTKTKTKLGFLRAL